MTELWDVAIVGAGPAGAAAALAARRADPAASVLLLDAAEFPRDKPCGDGIGPKVFDILERLGIGRGVLTEGTAPIARLALLSPGGAVASRPMVRPAAVVPRRLFDARLVGAAVEAGATLRRHRVRRLTQTPDGVVLDERWRARTVVAADGAESSLRRHLGLAGHRRGTVAVAVRGYADSASLPPGEQRLVMAEQHWPAYAWAFPVGDGSANVGYGELLQGSPPTRAHLLARLHDLLPGLGTVRLLRGHRLPLSPGRPRMAAGRVLFAGDAASLINPMTGEGIYYAVRSGSLAGTAAVQPGPAAAYRRAIAGALGGHLRHTDVMAWLGRYPTLLDIGIAAAGADQRFFDDMVELGLGDGPVTARLAAGLGRGAVSRLFRTPRPRLATAFGDLP